DRRQQREGGAELAGKMMHAEEGAVGAELFGGDREIDRLQQRIGRRSRLRLRRRGPVAEREEADFFHCRADVAAGAGLAQGSTTERRSVSSYPSCITMIASRQNQDAPGRDTSWVASTQWVRRHHCSFSSGSASSREARSPPAATRCSSAAA